MDWESSNVVRFDRGPLLQGQTRIFKKVPVTRLFLVLELCNVKQNLWEIMGWESSDIIL